MNYDFITDRIGVGQSPASAKDANALHAAGFTHIINCRGELDIFDLLVDTPFVRPGCYLWDGTEDWVPLSGQHKGLPWFQLAFDFALPLLALPGSKIYVCCHEGANRSATLAWAILRAGGLTAGECFAVIDSHRLIDIPGLLECGWWRDAETAVKQLGYV